MIRSVYSTQSRENGIRLINASEKGDIEIVSLLLSKDIYIHAQDKEGRCAIVAAAYKNHLEIADLLIAAGADVNMKDNTLQSAFLIAAMEGYLELMEKTLNAGADVRTDPTLDLVNPPGTYKGHKYIDEDVQELIKATWREHRYGPLAMMMLFTAMRPGEAAGIDCDVHVDWDNMVVMLRRATKKGREKKPKNNSIRDTPIFPELSDVLLGRCGLIYPRKRGDIIKLPSKSMLEKGLAKYLTFLSKRAGKPVMLTPHDFRGTCATNWRDAGYPEELIMKWGGWKDIKTLRNVYLKESDFSRKKADYTESEAVRKIWAEHQEQLYKCKRVGLM